MEAVRDVVRFGGRVDGTGAPPIPGSGTTAGLSPSGPSTAVYVTGAEAEAIIRQGTGSVVWIPGDEQWGQNASVAGKPPIQTDRVGSHGVIRSVGPIVRGPAGQVSVAVEVDPFEQPPPPPPPPPDEVPPDIGDGIIDPSEDVERCLGAPRR